MTFSIVIPAYNEAETIHNSIAATRAQQFPRQEFEIIVVDNNSKDRTSEAARDAGADKVVIETKQGTNLARQRGVEESTGTIVVFLDADSEPPPDWLRHIEKNLSRTGVVATTGPYDNGLHGFERSLDRLYTRIIIPMVPGLLHFLFRRKAGVLIEGNFAAWRWAIEKIGGLPPLKFYGDGAATAMLLTRHVGNILYDPTLNVKSSPRRFEKHGLLPQVYRYAAAYFKMYFSKLYR